MFLSMKLRNTQATFSSRPKGPEDDKGAGAAPKHLVKVCGGSREAPGTGRPRSNLEG